MSVEPVPPLAAKGHLALSEQEMVAWGERLGASLEAPIVVTISGELGTGKTTLTRAICRGYGVGDDVTSPTFTIVHEYTGRTRVYHLDLFRLQSSRELMNVGWDDLLSDDALVIVEWPERAMEVIPGGHIPISLAHLPSRPDRRLLYAGGHT